MSWEKTKKQFTKKKKKIATFFAKVKRILKIIFFTLTATIASLIFLLIYYTPSLNELYTEFRKPAVVIKDQYDNTLAVYGDYFTNIVPLDELPSYVPQAFVAVEDRHFYQHHGISITGIARAMFKNRLAGRIVQGGSTLTQQLAKQILVGNKHFNYNDKSYKRKLQELILAIQLELKFSKKDILTLYLNRVYFGSGCYGIDAASRHYFDKHASKLTLFEAAILAGLLKAPSKYSPHNNQELCLKRAKTVLTLMKECDYIDDPDRFLDINKEFSSPNRNLRYFTDWVYDSIGQCIDKDNMEDIEVFTTFDVKLQKKALRACKKVMEQEGYKLGVKEVALVTMSPDGAVRTMIGGINHRNSQFNRVTQAQRQAGSAIKPLIFLAALENGYSTEDYIDDSPFEKEDSSWKPSNFHWKSVGSITLHDALVNSVNAVPIRLTENIGIRRIQNTLKKMGIYTKQPDDLTIALGSGDANLIDLTAAYASFTNEGYLPSPYGVLYIKNAKGEVIYEHIENKGKKVMSDTSLSQMRVALNDIVQRGTGQRAQIGRQISGKTGSNRNSDAWMIGYYEEKPSADKDEDYADRANDLAFGIWVGGDTQREEDTMDERSRGGRIPAMIVKEFFSR
ncbi:MAG: transglycosylase domain-containing protein [Alphaproteobacteria bacterium]|nr:MAG: transglycosylase domain-containing protein [Alphaproteobacteria bacterium]